MRWWPYKIPGWVHKLFPPVFWHGKRDGQSIYLTFDDGPTEKLSPWILDTLDQYQMKATFFLVGDNVSELPNTVSDIVNRGHDVGNHTYNHLVGWNTPNEKYIENVRECEELISSWSSKKFFRPPHGRIKPSQIKELKRDGLKIIMWDLLAGDFDPNLNPQKAITKLKKITKPGSVIIFHDNEKARERLEVMLPAYLKFIREVGLEPKLLPL